MKESWIQIVAFIIAVINSGIAVFQILLFLGFPLAEYSWGGKYQGILPKKMRIMSFTSAILLMLFTSIFLIHVNVLPVKFHLPTDVLIIIITIFMGINTLGNLASKSNKERMVMTPLSAVNFLSGLLIVIYS
ncbi:hypothetical protein [Bacillus sp. FJAT-49736]|uniref:hypothetical protein n=1 Tax=Bacillus sp. FJAT-49736 TaxID=2833582 RepID=UPI001BC99ED3|nr:hypothetical protein [Bacillus sp. FJAT-49736]MBS4174109.1 hypothetical protein [Bacillus sp. FJAT-49736]